MSVLVDPNEIRQFYEGWQDHPAWCQQCLSIQNREGKTVPLVPMAAHQRLSRAIRKQRKRGKPVRIVYLKPRRVGVSVGCSAEIFQTTAFLPGQHAFIVSYVKRSSLEVYSYIEQFFNSYKPYGGLIEMEPGTCDKNRASWANKSYIEVATAKNVNTGRSFDLRHVLLDEFAYCENASKLLTALLSSVPDDPATTVIAASTANGVGGTFYEICHKARDKTRESEWVFLFFAWWEEPSYRRPLEVAPDVFQRSLSRNHPVYGDELTERGRYNLDLEQLNWRRWTIANKCEWNLDKFRQEYPGNPEEAFIASGRPRFPHASLNRMPVIEDAVTGELEMDTVGTRRRVLFQASEDGRGTLTIYRKPVTHGEYAMGGDPSEGRDVKSGEPGNQDPDFSVANVFDINTGEQVAHYRARTQPAAFGEVMYALGWYYNWAYLVPEAKGAGLGTIEKLLEMQYPLERLHRRRTDADRAGSTLLQDYGFETTTVNRPQLVSALDDALRDRSIILRDANTVQECRTFVTKPNGKAEHAAECHDDEVLSLGLAVVGIRFYPRTKKPATVQDRPTVTMYGRRRYTEED